MESWTFCGPPIIKRVGAMDGIMEFGRDGQHFPVHYAASGSRASVEFNTYPAYMGHHHNDAGGRLGHRPAIRRTIDTVHSILTKV